MQLKRAIALVLVVSLVVSATPALAAIAEYSVTMSGDVPVSTPDTPTITVSSADPTEINLVDAWQGNELNITVSEGSVVVSGDPGASATIDVDNIEGSQTQVTAIDAGGNWLELDPADKNRVDVRGDVNTLAFSEIGVDDGATDIQIGGTTGGSAELRLHGLSATTQYALYDASRDEVLGEATTDGSGTLTVTSDLPDGTHALQVRTAGSFAAPTVSNPQPTGTVTDRPTELAVDVTADAWPAEVEFTLEGVVVDTQTVTSNGTVTANVNIDDLGTYDWSATVTDGVGNTDTVNAQFETPSTITIREEHAPQTIVDNATINLRFFTANGDIAIQRQATDGTVEMDGLPDTEFVVFAESPDHYDRTIYIESIYEQENMFLLNETEFPRSENEAIRSRFIYEDLTGEFTRTETTIQIQRAVDINGDNESEYRTVAGDYWGASNEFEAILEYGERYKITLVNQESGEVNEAGSHIPTEDLAQTIRVSGLVEDFENATGVYANAELDTNTSTIEIAYNDPVDTTDELVVRVESRRGDEVLFEDTVAGPLGSYSTTVELNETQAESDWVVHFDAGDRHRSAVPVGSGAVGLPVAVPAWLLTLLMTMALTFVGALYGPRTALLGAWAMVFVAGGAAMFGWAFSSTSVLVAGLVAVAATLISRAVP